MNKVACLLWSLVALFPLFAGCSNQPNHAIRQDPTVSIEQPKPDVTAILANATDLREEKLFLVTLKFEKEQLSLDPWAHMQNAMAAESRTLIVGEQTFNEYEIGKKVSSVGDGWGFVFNGEIATYVVRPTEKKIESQYFWVDDKGTQLEIRKEEYDEALQQLHAGNRPVVTVPFAGAVRTYVLKKPLKEYTFVDRQPLNRYFVTIRVQNSTLTLDFTKHVRNAANVHDITLEVPQDVYEKTGEAWDAQVNTGSLFLKGRLSELHGKVLKKWMKTDSSFHLATTKEGQQFIVPK